VRRPARLEDIPTIVEFALAFHGEAAPPFAFEPDQAARTARRCITHPDGYLAVLEARNDLGGCIAGWVSRHPFGKFEIAIEMLWWVDPDFRGIAALRLHKGFEEWARAKGCRLASMSAIAGDDRLADFYARGGYRPFEVNFLKELA
jgi:hypothetical protein